MWERAQLKEKAKRVLKGSYWKAFLVSIVMGAVSGGSSNAGSNIGSSFGGDTDFNWNTTDFNQMDSAVLFRIIAVAIAVFLAIMIIGTLIKVFVGYHLEVGGSRYFIQAAQDDINMGYLGYGFQDGRYMSIIKAMFWKGLMIFLWTLLLIIPGIIKGYAYMMVPNILADNPNIGTKRALELSDQMMKGHKLDTFILEISFIGWYLLGVLACGIGVVFVMPYQRSTMAELYLVLREDMIDKGLVSHQELNIKKQVQMYEY